MILIQTSTDAHEAQTDRTGTWSNTTVCQSQFANDLQNKLQRHARATSRDTSRGGVFMSARSCRWVHVPQATPRLANQRTRGMGQLDGRGTSS